MDIQVNGVAGVDFSSPGLTQQDVMRAAEALASAGTGLFCPTIVTGSPEMYRGNLQAIAAAMQALGEASPIAGIHIEGPYISPNDGARGAHPAEHVRPPDVKEFDLFMEWADGGIRILTLAPEMPGALELIRHARSQNVIVALGHHEASGEALQAAVDAGAVLGTHIGNGIGRTMDRHENPLWWQLACDDLIGSFITDGHHLPPAFIKTALRAKGVSRFVVTSDSTMLAGLEPGRYEMFGSAVVLEPGGRLYVEESGYLAGSASTMLQCMNHLASLGLLDERGLWRVGRDNALDLLGLHASRLDAVDSAEAGFRDGKFHLQRPGRGQ